MQRIISLILHRKLEDMVMKLDLLKYNDTGNVAPLFLLRSNVLKVFHWKKIRNKFERKRMHVICINYL